MPLWLCHDKLDSRIFDKRSLSRKKIR